MRILHSAKNNKPIDSTLASPIIGVLEIQLSTLFLLYTSSPIYSYVLKIIEKKSGIQSLVIIILVLNLIQLLLIIFKVFITKNSNGKIIQFQQSHFLRCLQIKPYLLFTQIINISVLGLQNNQQIINVFSIFNIIFCIAELLVIQIISVSYRFIEKNHIRRKNNSIVPWLLIIPIIFTLHFYDQTYASVFLLVRALIQLYFNFNNLENEEIRFCEWFYPFMSIELTFIIFADFYMNLSIFSNFIILTFTIIFSVYSCNNISSHFSIQILKHHLKNCTQIMESQNIDNSVKGGLIQINEQQLKKTLLQLRILIKIYLSRYSKTSIEEKLDNESDNFDNWWNFYDKLILDHRVYCQNVTCECNKMEFMKCKDNHEVEKKIFIDKIYTVIKKLQAQSSVSVNKLKIIENYFLIELQKKPMKTYYQLMKIEKDQLNREETLQVENLIHETRDNFKQLFLRQKVQNTDLDIDPLFQFQDHLKDMRSRLNEMAVEYRQFYEIFANNFVQMQTLKQKTRKLTEFKRLFSEEIELCLRQFDKSLELMTFCMVYFRFFDQYTNRLEKLEERAQYLVETFNNPVSEIKRGSVDIFDPHYGAVKADLVFNPGRIVTITKNLCHLLGFTHQQLSGQKINKMMPTMFSRNHDKFLRTFVDKGSMKMLKFKEKVLYAKLSSKFIIPISVKLKVDYTNSDGLYAVTFMRPTQTKSEFILMNNYGKIEQITTGLYNKFFGRALGDQVSKVKRLCASKLLLSLNYLLKNNDQVFNDQVYEGLILTSDDQDSLMSYYKFPELKKIYKGKSQNGAQTSRSTASVQNSYSSGQGSRSLDLSQDMSKYSVDLKESIRNYFKSVDIQKVNGFHVSYRFQEYITNQFKCKILQILSIRQQISGPQLGVCLKQQILDVAEFMGIDKQQISQFSIVKNYNQLSTKNYVRSLKNTILMEQNEFKQGSVQFKAQDITAKYLVDTGSSESSSMKQGNEERKKKQTIISAFDQKTIINVNLEFALTILIFLMAFILIVVCVFSLQLQGNYQALQNDNMIITNFRINFLLRIAVQQMYQIYDTYGLQAPYFLSQKRTMLTDRMKQLLKKSTEWIGLSWPKYEKLLTMKDTKTDSEQTQSVLSSLQTVYSTFLMAQTRGYYIIDNYIVINSNLLAITDQQIINILDQSNSYNIQIHIVVAIYASVLVTLLVVMIWIKKIALQKEDKVIDFLPFLKAFKAKRMALFYEKFFEYNKEIENLDFSYVQDLSIKIQNANQNKKITKNQILAHGLRRSQNIKNQKNNQSRLIRVVKNQESGITVKIVLFALIVAGLCLFVIFYSEFFFIEANDKFNSYVQLKGVSFLVQLIPSRIILLYFINFHYIINNQPVIDMPQPFFVNVHDRTFQFQKDTSSPIYYGTEMQKVITNHFTQNICNLVKCSQNSMQSSQIDNQQVFYLSYRYVNAFNYLRKINDILPNDPDAKGTMKKWIDQNNVFEILNSIDFILDLMKKNQDDISLLFTNQIVQIGYILLSLSLTLIPILIVVMMFGRKKFMQLVQQKLECTQNIYKQISWPMLSQNTYAANYFQNKLRNSKKY